ncbi:Trypanosomal VSG domain containing protein, putative [Trypanosoma equiperdum]|uniref:Trypanosomal VSG domain containing protein, putative n=1 Tax=Trypanosoma equiperdum TaxID=5694 RepID=A0A1G4I224_TRYEQ|nr:Trypanosomal VSG domain containing protein, putative [Trypanosoma equiperdum]
MGTLRVCSAQTQNGNLCGGTTGAGTYGKGGTDTAAQALKVWETIKPLCEAAAVELETTEPAITTCIPGFKAALGAGITAAGDSALKLGNGAATTWCNDADSASACVEYIQKAAEGAVGKILRVKHATSRGCACTREVESSATNGCTNANAESKLNNIAKFGAFPFSAGGSCRQQRNSKT